MIDPLWLARREQEQAARLLRTIDAEIARRSSARLSRERIVARERLVRALERLAAIEATQPDGAGIHQ